MLIFVYSSFCSLANGISENAVFRNYVYELDTFFPTSSLWLCDSFVVQLNLFTVAVLLLSPHSGLFIIFTCA